MRKLLILIAFIVLTVGISAQNKQATIYTEYPYIMVNDWATITGALAAGNTTLTGYLLFPDPGTSVNSFLTQWQADNTTTIQTASLQTIFGANPYFELKAPDNSGTATSIAKFYDDNMMISGTISGTDSLLMADVAYNATTWNGSFGAATKNALRDKIETMGGSADSTFNNIIAYDTLTIGYAVPDETLPVFEMKGDADDDAEDVTEVFTITLDPNIDPTKSQWVITSTQGAGYNFDKDIYFAAGAAEISAISDFTVVSDNDLILQGDELNFNQQSDIATGAAFDFDQNKTEYELTGSNEQAVMSIQGNINKSSGDYIGILLDVLETAITGSNDELMALRTGGADKFAISNTGVVGLLNGTTLDNIETDTLIITETVVKIDSELIVTGNISGLTAFSLDTDATVILTASDCKNNIRYNDDADVIDYTLPAAAAGLVVLFYDIGGGVITIDPVDGTDTIYLNGTSVGAGDAIDSPGVVGDFVALMAIDATRWVTIGRSGVWIDGGAD